MNRLKILYISSFGWLGDTVYELERVALIYIFDYSISQILC